MLLLLASSPVVFGPTRAQERETRPPLLGSVAGTVFDSVHQAPLVGALVIVENTTRSAITNGYGGFAIDSIPPGSYRVRVEHPFLDSIGVQMRTGEFSLAENETRHLELAVPSSETLVAISCPPARRNLGPSAIIGRLLDADSDEPVQGARVSYAWAELSFAAGLRREPRVRDAVTGADGVFRICGLPSDVEGTLQAVKGGVSTAEIRVRIQGEPLLVQGLRIGTSVTVVRDDSARSTRDAAGVQRFSAPVIQRGEAVLTGRVVAANGQPIAGARVDVEGTRSAALTNSNGEFVLRDLPSGTQQVWARQLGYAPVSVPVELSTKAPANVIIRMSEPAQVLPSVTVQAERDAGLDQVGFTERKRALSGYFVTGEEVMQRGPNLLTDVMRTIPMLRVVPAGNNEYIVESARAPLLGGNCVRYYLDGAPFEAVFPGDVDRLIPPWNVGAMEVYSGSSAPAQFQIAGASNCVIVVIWSKFRLEQAARRRR